VNLAGSRPHRHYRISLGGGTNERYSEIATEFVRLKVDVILTVGTAVPAAKQATSTIPIVFAIAVDPVGSGLVASLARPDGNVTGSSGQSVELAGKRVEILRELLPDLRRMAIIGNVDYEGAVREIGEVQAAAAKLGLNADVLEIRHARDVVPAFDTLKSGTQALYVCPDALVNANHARINTLALGSRLATMHGVRDYIGAGGLMSYGPAPLTYSGAQATKSTRFSRGRSPPTSRSSSRPSSCSSST